MKRNHQNRNVIQQLSAHFRYALLVLVLAAPSAYAAPSPAPDSFAQADSNHDGRMTVVEWTGGDPGRMADFKKRDANHDGIVTEKEAIAYGRAHGIANQIMLEADKNHDGYLSRAEVKAYYASREGPPR